MPSRHLAIPCPLPPPLPLVFPFYVCSILLLPRSFLFADHVLYQPLAGGSRAGVRVWPSPQPLNRNTQEEEPDAPHKTNGAGMRVFLFFSSFRLGEEGHGRATRLFSRSRPKRCHLPSHSHGVAYSMSDGQETNKKKEKMPSFLFLFLIPHPQSPSTLHSRIGDVSAVAVICRRPLTRRSPPCLRRCMLACARVYVCLSWTSRSSSQLISDTYTVHASHFHLFRTHTHTLAHPHVCIYIYINLILNTLSFAQLKSDFLSAFSCFLLPSALLSSLVSRPAPALTWPLVWFAVWCSLHKP